MSRDYNEFCPSCKKFNAKLELLCDTSADYDNKGISKYQGQCSCGENFVKTKTIEYTDLGIVGNTEKDWKKASKQIYGD